jgi:hypothetical protein
MTRQTTSHALWIGAVVGLAVNISDHMFHHAVHGSHVKLIGAENKNRGIQRTIRRCVGRESGAILCQSKNVFDSRV